MNHKLSRYKSNLIKNSRP